VFTPDAPDAAHLPPLFEKYGASPAGDRVGGIPDVPLTHPDVSDMLLIVAVCADLVVDAATV
jgi:hypothetical protein